MFFPYIFVRIYNTDINIFLSIDSLVLVDLTIYSRFYFCVMKFRLKLKKIGKTTRPFRYDLNQIPYDYTVEVSKRFKRVDLIDRVPGEL